MKKNHLYYAVIILCSITACKKNVPADTETFSRPNSLATINTITGVNSCFNWESNPYVSLTNGQTRILPWYNGATTQIPNFILSDYKKEDGWELLYNFLSGTENGQNYLFFYNKFTGIIRTYYFLADDVTVGSNGMWGLSFTNENALLNNIGYFATPINDMSQDPLAISSNLSLDANTKGIARGWNAFDTEITYDPNASSKLIKMRVFSTTSNISQVSLSGDVQLSSAGTIVNVGTKNGLQDAANSAAKSGGDAAKDYIKSKVKSDSSSFIKKVFGNAASVVIGGGVKEIINAGINLLFGSFIGKKSETTNTTQKIEFKTNGTINLIGTISSTSANNVSSIAGLYTPGTLPDISNFLLPCFDKQLGVWNLESQPIVRTSEKAFGGNYSPPYDDIYDRYYFLDPSSINVKINPDLIPEIQSYQVTTDLFYYSQYKGNYNWNNSVVTHNISGGTLAYQDEANKFYQADFGSFIEQIHGPIPIPGNPKEDQEIPNINVNGFNKNFVVKVTVTLIPRAGYDQTPIVITRSYIPDYQYY
jgi:hypothetical protein